MSSDFPLQPRRWRRIRFGTGHVPDRDLEARAEARWRSQALVGHATLFFLRAGYLVGLTTYRRQHVYRAPSIFN